MTLAGCKQVPALLAWDLPDVRNGQGGRKKKKVCVCVCVRVCIRSIINQKQQIAGRFSDVGLVNCVQNLFHFLSAVDKDVCV